MSETPTSTYAAEIQWTLRDVVSATATASLTSSTPCSFIYIMTGSQACLHTTSAELASSSTIEDFSIGTGRTIFFDTLIPALLKAEHEVVLATCFWAPGPTLIHLHDALIELSRQLTAQPHRTEKLKVYICLSSRSLLQKLFHTSSPRGHIYPPESWSPKLGLPFPSEIPSLDLQVKSLFFRPFSVLHSKYLIVDRRDVWLPSCNVSWEEWYECQVHLRGPIAQQVYDFWTEVWMPESIRGIDAASNSRPSPIKTDVLGLHPLSHLTFGYEISMTLLPHPQSTLFERNFWLLHSNTVPKTPLNAALLDAFDNASHSVVLLTPNFTSAPVYDALLAALTRGVNVTLITNRRMMVLEQLLTAGTISELYIWQLMRAYKKLISRTASNNDVEAGNTHKVFGKLEIDYFVSRDTTDVQEHGSSLAAGCDKTHVKLTKIDDRIIILGSGNMDRASWFTSQELGVKIESEVVVQRIWTAVETGLDGCRERYYSG